MVNFHKIGATKAIISKHVFSKELKSEMNRYPTTTCIGLGQGGGRIAAELSRFDFPTFIVNSSESDMNEHHDLIPEERRILTLSKNYNILQGSGKNARVGFQIAKENAQKYKELAVKEEVQTADFVWVSVSLGGGTGNGALKVALNYISQVRKNKQTPNGKIPLGVICSLPSKNEKGSIIRENALAGINLLQNLINEGSIGSVLVIDNEKMTDYYANAPLKTYGGTEIDAKSYSNMIVAAITSEVATLPLLRGRSVFDSTEYIDTMSTPGWLSISKVVSEDDDDLEKLTKSLFSSNEVLADNNVQDAVIGAIGVIYPDGKIISPKIADDVYHYTSDFLNAMVHYSISVNSSLKNLTLYGVFVTSSAPKRILALQTELEEWKSIEKKKDEDARKLQDSMHLKKDYDDYFSADNLPKAPTKKISLDFFGDNEEAADQPTQSTLSAITDLDDLDF